MPSSTARRGERTSTSSTPCVAYWQGSVTGLTGSKKRLSRRCSRDHNARASPGHRMPIGSPWDPVSGFICPSISRSICLGTSPIGIFSTFPCVRGRVQSSALSKSGWEDRVGRTESDILIPRRCLRDLGHTTTYGDAAPNHVAIAIDSRGTTQPVSMTRVCLHPCLRIILIGCPTYPGRYTTTVSRRLRGDVRCETMRNDPEAGSLFFS